MALGSLKDFSSALVDARRTAMRMGRPLSTQEASGISSGFASGAADRLARAKQLALEGRSLDITERGQDIQKYGIDRQTYVSTRGQDLDVQLQKYLAFKARQHDKVYGAGAGEGGGTDWGGIAGSVLGAGTAAALTLGTAGTGAVLAHPLLALQAGGLGGAVSAGLIGAGIGGKIGSAVGSGCIIITACTGRDSYEVQVARKFRDSFMDPITLGGYYVLCERVVPTLRRSRLARRLARVLLVNPLVDFGERALGYRKSLEKPSSGWITRAFITLCNLIGRTTDKNIVSALLEAHNA